MTPSTSYVIRPAELRDAEGLARVHVDTWRAAYGGIVSDSHLAGLDYTRLAERWRQPERLANTIVALDEGGEVTGFVSSGTAQPKGGDVELVLDGEIYAIYVLPWAQHQGLGSALFLAAVERLLVAGHHSLVLWALRDNPSRGFYEALGGKLVAASHQVIGGLSMPTVAYGWPSLVDLRDAMSARPARSAAPEAGLVRA